MSFFSLSCLVLFYIVSSVNSHYYYIYTHYVNCVRLRDGPFSSFWLFPRLQAHICHVISFELARGRAHFLRIDV